jgi:hypothetical protein
VLQRDVDCAGAEEFVNIQPGKNGRRDLETHTYSTWRCDSLSLDAPLSYWCMRP